MSPIIGSRPRPRVLVHGFGDHPEVLAYLDAAVATLQVVDSLTEIRQEEWDCLMTDSWLQIYRPHGPNVEPEKHISVLCFSAVGASWSLERLVIQSDQDDFPAAIQVGSQICNEFMLSKADLEPELAELCETALLQTARSRARQITFACRPLYSNASPVQCRVALARVTPLLLTATDHALAARYDRREEAEAWIIPADVPAYVPWISAALDVWHRGYPDRFPQAANWTTDSRWRTSAELAVLSRLRDAAAERQAVLSGLDAREAELLEELGRATVEADSSDRLLLTAKGSELVGAVATALRQFGFVVVDMDESAEPGDHREDLRVENPETNWIALVEVRSYKGGAQLNDLLRVGRFVERYAVEEARLPDGRWYIANQFRGRDPGARPPMLSSNDPELRTFADAGGAAIDTTYLFELLKDVADGQKSLANVRSELIALRGRAP